jgi:hypothetical protein
MKSYVVTVGPFDGELIKTQLQARGFEQTRVLVSENASSAESLASSILLVKQLPVALVLNAGAYEPSMVHRISRQFESLLGAVAPRTDWRVLMMVPEMEILFFQVPGLLEALGLPAPTPDQLKIAEYVPGKVLEEIVAPVAAKRARKTPWRQWLMKRFSRLPHEEIWKQEPFAELLRFLTSFEQDSEAALPGRQ